MNPSADDGYRSSTAWEQRDIPPSDRAKQIGDVGQLIEASMFAKCRAGGQPQHEGNPEGLCRSWNAAGR